MVAVLGGVLAGHVAVSLAADELDKGFQTPPDSARPHTYWFWMNGNITREGITADLEAMARIGIGGALIFSHLPDNIPAGSVRYNSPEWYALIKHAASEARRLGLDLGIHNGGGWTGSSGPWNKPENGMQVVVSSEVRVKGPVRFDGVLPQPKANLGYYRDIAVLAFPTPPDEATLMADCPPKVSVSTEPAEAAASKTIKCKSQVIVFEFKQPFLARSLVFTPATPQSCRGVLECSDDGQVFRRVRECELVASMSETDPKPVFTFAPTTARIFRLQLESKGGINPLSTEAIELTPRLMLDQLGGKTFLYRKEFPGTPGNGELPGIPGGNVIELTDRLATDGRLVWDVPDGNWTVLRLGHTANGRLGQPASIGSLGLECDKLNANAVDAHWAGMLNPLIAELGLLAGPGPGGLKTVHIDSYEAGTQNWTDGFREQFRKRRSYDPGPYLPVLAGHVIGSTAISERFLWDLRRTVGDLFNENYAGRFATLAHNHGLRFSLEPYDQCPASDIEYGGMADLPMGEFWQGGQLFIWSCKIASSVGHVYGRKIIGAEAFTSVNKFADPYALKAEGDRAFCLGINRLVFHRFAHQPWLNVAPGMMFSTWGTQLDRTVTWWEQGQAWIKYLTRCQYLLQQGLFAADVCFYVGESVPMRAGKAGVPIGYDYDGCDTATLHRFTVRDGRLVLPDGMSYRLLVLPGEQAMSPAVLRKIGELADAGTTIIGRKPERSVGLSGYPQADAEVNRLVDKLWANGGIKDQSVAITLTEHGIEPDFQAQTKTATGLRYIHRSLPGAEVYFVSNPATNVVEAEAFFRVSGRRPELWHPDTGMIEYATVYAAKGNRTAVPLRLEPCGSVFVVFRAGGSGASGEGPFHTRDYDVRIGLARLRAGWSATASGSACLACRPL